MFNKGVEKIALCAEYLNVINKVILYTVDKIIKTAHKTLSNWPNHRPSANHKTINGKTHDPLITQRINFVKPMSVRKSNSL